MDQILEDIDKQISNAGGKYMVNISDLLLLEKIYTKEIQILKTLHRTYPDVQNILKKYSVNNVSDLKMHLANGERIIETIIAHLPQDSKYHQNDCDFGVVDYNPLASAETMVLGVKGDNMYDPDDITLQGDGANTDMH